MRYEVGVLHHDAARSATTRREAPRRGAIRYDAVRCVAKQRQTSRSDANRHDAARCDRTGRHMYINNIDTSASYIHSTPEGLVLYYINRIVSSVSLCLSVCSSNYLTRQIIYRD